ncbi:thiol-disulfide isomerase/thioredoxin [Aminobacter aganoensis]|uniref:Thiol-disulfide isomerase/thioredoxin n=2 Tax=Phyllobacteriaceae TaxID=69277 RepID=A0A7X0FBU3_9HYPH|nr:thiol-disulfide isomerase/thioredoxin [Aminobacter aganoensis]
MIPAPRHIILAAVAGVIAGAVAVYVSSTLPGNNAPSPQVAADTNAEASAEDKVCAAKADIAKAIGAAATGQVAAMMPADPPQSLKKLAFNDSEGKPMTVADHAGRTLLINLWATWCAPCRAEMPALDALEREMGGENFEVVAVNVDTGDDTKPKKFLDEISITSLGYYRDNTLAVFNDLKKRGLALGLPVTLLVDGEGCLLANMNGPAEWASPDAKKLIEAALAK